MRPDACGTIRDCLAQVVRVLVKGFFLIANLKAIAAYFKRLSIEPSPYIADKYEVSLGGFSAKSYYQMPACSLLGREWLLI
jgi:hypothetical protein